MNPSKLPSDFESFLLPELWIPDTLILFSASELYTDNNLAANGYLFVVV